MGFFGDLYEGVRNIRQRRPQITTNTDISDQDNLIDLSDPNELYKFIEDIRKLSLEFRGELEEYHIMAQDSLIGSGLELICDDATQEDTQRGKIFWIEALEDMDDGDSEDDDSIIETRIIREDDSEQEDGISEEDDMEEMIDHLTQVLEIMQVDEKSWGESWSILVDGGLFEKTYYTELNAPNIDERIAKKLGFLFEKVDDYSTVSDIQQYGDTVCYGQDIFDEDGKPRDKFDLMPTNDFIHFINDKGVKRMDLVMEYPADMRDPNIPIDENQNEYKIRYGTSYLETVRDAWRIVDLIENIILAVRFGISNFYRIFEIEVGGASKAETAKIVREFKQRLHSVDALNVKENTLYSVRKPVPYNKNIYTPVRDGKGRVSAQLVGGDFDIGQLLDLEYFRNKLFAAMRIPKAFLGFEECYRFSTLLTLLDGSTYEIDFMAEHEEDFIGKGILSCSPSGEIVPTRIAHVKKTRRNAIFVRVHLDNGEHVDVTPDHLMMLRDGSFIEAGKLEAGDSLMPLYKSLSIKVVKVEPLDIVEDAYDLGVESENHTFALNAGIFAHNSMPGGIGNQSLTRIDIRYARTVNHIKQILRAGNQDKLEYYCRVKGYDKWIGKFRVETSKITTAEEADKRDDVMASIELAGAIRNLFTDMPNIDAEQLLEYILTNVLDMADMYAEVKTLEGQGDEITPVSMDGDYTDYGSEDKTDYEIGEG